MTTKPETKTRLMVIEVTAPVDWLTGGGDFTEAEGWEDLKGLMPQRLMSSSPFQFQVATVDFLEWQEVPE
jgi:hypothetical protein